jgi:hypothetical protein
MNKEDIDTTRENEGSSEGTQQNEDEEDISQLIATVQCSAYYKRKLQIHIPSGAMSW